MSEDELELSRNAINDSQLPLSFAKRTYDSSQPPVKTVQYSDIRDVTLIDRFQRKDSDHALESPADARSPRRGQARADGAIAALAADPELKQGGSNSVLESPLKGIGNFSWHAENVGIGKLRQQRNSMQPVRRARSRAVDLSIFLTFILAHRFVRQMLRLIRRFRFGELTRAQLELIDDKSFQASLSQQSQSKGPGVWAVLAELFAQHLRRLEVFSPNIGLLQAWRFIMLFQILVQIIIIPVKFSFDIRFKENGFQYNILYRVPGVALFVDILINFNTGYYQKGILILERHRIVKHYLKFHFWIDLITTLSLLLSEEVVNTKGIIDLMFLLRTMWISDLAGNLIEHFQIAQR